MHLTHSHTAWGVILPSLLKKTFNKSLRSHDLHVCFLFVFPHQLNSCFSSTWGKKGKEEASNTNPSSKASLPTPTPSLLPLVTMPKYAAGLSIWMNVLIKEVLTKHSQNNDPSPLSASFTQLCGVYLGPDYRDLLINWLRMTSLQCMQIKVWVSEGRVNLNNLMILLPHLKPF